MGRSTLIIQCAQYNQQGLYKQETEMKEKSESQRDLKMLKLVLQMEEESPEPSDEGSS